MPCHIMPNPRQVKAVSTLKTDAKVLAKEMFPGLTTETVAQGINNSLLSEETVILRDYTV